MDDLIEMSLNVFIRALENILRKHEYETHNGATCADERANAVAFIAHRLGADMDLVLERRREYDEFHKAQRG